MMGHGTTCSCAICTDVRARSAPVIEADRMILAHFWEEWISTTDGESAKLRAGESGAPGSPRWVALQAIAAARDFYSKEKARA